MFDRFLIWVQLDYEKCFGWELVGELGEVVYCVQESLVVGDDGMDDQFMFYFLQQSWYLVVDEVM